MNLLDGAAAVYAALAAGRGLRRGTAAEGYRLLRVVISIFAGCGLFTLLGKAAAGFSSTLGQAGGLGFAAGVGAGWWATRALKARMLSFLQNRFSGKYNRCGGALAGLLRALTVVGALVAFLKLSPWIPGSESLLQNSLVGRVASVFSSQEENAGTAPTEHHDGD